MDKLKILIADGNITYRRLVSEAVERTGFGVAERIASNGAIAIEWIRQCSIDVVIMDVSILETEGMQVLERLKNENKELEIIIISTSEPRNAAVTLEALKLGATDFVLKPSGESDHRNMESIKSCLQSLFAQVKVKKYSLAGDGTTVISSGGGKGVCIADRAISSCQRSYTATGYLWRGADLVLIASSTGGPQALETVLEGLPDDFNRPVLVVQHMPPDFTRVLAHTLDKKCRLKVFEAFDSAPVEEGHIAIAPGGLHMIVEASGDARKLIRLQNTPFVNGVKPSADVLFRSVADAYKGARILVVVLTGMGSDGTSGIAEIKRKCDCYCITQSEKTCVVYGMPRTVYDAGLSDEVADIDDIAGRIMRIGSDRG